MSKKIPFDIKFRPQIESGEYKVETAMGCPARIVCWDVNCDLPILALVTINDEKVEEMAVGFYADGTNLLDEPLYDRLFLITPEPELSEFEECVCTISNLNLNMDMVDEIKAAAQELLELARKELESYHDESNPRIESVANLERAVSCGGRLPIWLEDKFKEQRELGRAEALKDLPR